MVRRPGIAGMVSACLLSCAGCAALGSDPAAPPVASATISGTLVAVGGPAPGASRPVAGDVSVRRGGEVIASAHTANGSFSVPVPPGRYVVTGRLGDVLCAAPHPVTAAANGTVLVHVACSIK